MRKRLVIAFIVVALLSAIASSWFHTLIQAYRLPGWLNGLIRGPEWRRHLLPGAGQQPGLIPVRHTALIFFLVEAGVLLVLIGLVAVVAARPVLLPVRRLAQAPQRMSGGDLSVRIQPQGRDELAQLVTSFNGMASALEGKVGELEQMEARARQFAGDVSHELRTPLTAMTAVADILHDHPGLTGDAATAALVTDETYVAHPVGKCLRTRGWSTVGTDVPAGLTARLDRRRFDVLLANLVGNALRHGGLPVTVTAGTQPDGPGGGQLAMEVRDHGRGLAPTAIPHVFDRFFKADTARARSEGSGLGLAIAWENTRLHGGRIYAGNHPGGGAVFTVSLPLDAPGSP